MKRLILGLILVLLALTRPLGAAGTATVTHTTVVYGGLRFERYSVALTSTAGGAVSGNAFTVVPGRLHSVWFVPGSTTPSDAYDVTIAAGDGTYSTGDVLEGGGADRSNTLASYKTFDPPVVMDSPRTLDVVVANAGNAKTLTVVILVQVN